MDEITRRHFLYECGLGLGSLALGSLAGCSSKPSASSNFFSSAHPLLPKAPHFPGKAKAVIYLHMAGAPSQLDLFDYKPELQKMNGQRCPPSFLEGKTFAFIRGVPKMLGPTSNFRQRGQSGAWISDNLPHLSSVCRRDHIPEGDADRPVQSCARAIVVAHWQPEVGPTEHGLMGNVWIGERE